MNLYSILIKTKLKCNKIKRVVFAKYNYKCLVTGIGYNWKELGKTKHSWRGITGAHIKPRAHNGPYSSDNIIPLIEPVHQLFEKGIFTINNDFSLKVHDSALSQSSLSNFHDYNNHKLVLPVIQKTVISQNILVVVLLI